MLAKTGSGWTVTLINIETREREVRTDLTPAQAREICIERNAVSGVLPDGSRRELTTSDLEARINMEIFRPWNYSVTPREITVTDRAEIKQAMQAMIDGGALR